MRGLKRASDCLLEVADDLLMLAKEGDPRAEPAYAKVVDMIGDLAYFESDFALNDP